MIEQAVRGTSREDSDVRASLWEPLAADLSMIIGTRGFESLYLRSLHRARAQFPWLPLPTQTTDDALKQLALSLNQRNQTEAEAANAALLIIFTDTLILLIGELVTHRILRAAWGGNVMNDAGPERQT